MVRTHTHHTPHMFHTATNPATLQAQALQALSTHEFSLSDNVHTECTSHCQSCCCAMQCSLLSVQHCMHTQSLSSWRSRLPTAFQHCTAFNLGHCRGDPISPCVMCCVLSCWTKVSALFPGPYQWHQSTRPSHTCPPAPCKQCCPTLHLPRGSRWAKVNL